jgi:carbonic anhydrase
MIRRLLLNNGHSMQVDGEYGELIMPDGIYEAKTFHFHFPSEHAVNGNLSAGELHIVHQRKGSFGVNDLVTIALMMEVATEDRPVPPETRYFFNNLGFQALLPVPLPRTGYALQIRDAVDLNTFSTQLAGRYQCYWGSLTSPPCSETVKWMVFEKPIIVPTDVIQNFHVAFPPPMNNRPIQPRNGRIISENCKTGGWLDTPLGAAEAAGIVNVSLAQTDSDTTPGIRECQHVSPMATPRTVSAHVTESAAVQEPIATLSHEEQQLAVQKASAAVATAEIAALKAELNAKDTLLKTVSKSA